MVTRQTSLPAPTAPPPPPPPGETEQPFGRHAEPETDAQGARLASQSAVDSPYGDMGNPWHEEGTAVHSSSKSAAPLSTHSQQVTVRTQEQDIPDILKPGWSGQNTPRSSMDSNRSKDFWESSDDEEGKKEKPRTDGLQKGLGKELGAAAQLPASLQIKRKPVSPQQEQAAFLPPLDFASNNPFRPQVSDELKDGSSIWADGSVIKGKGKAVDSQSEALSHGLTGLHIGQPTKDTSDLSNLRGDDDHDVWTRADANLSAISAVPPAVPSEAPPPAPEPQSPFSKQPPLIPVSPQAWQASHSHTSDPAIRPPQPSPLPEQEARYTNELLDRGDRSGSISLGDEMKAIPNHPLVPGASAFNSTVPPSGQGVGSTMDLLSHEDPTTPAFNDHGSQHQSRTLASFSYGSSSWKGTRDTAPIIPSGGLVRGDIDQQSLNIDTNPENGSDQFADLPPVKPPRPAPVSHPLTETEVAEMREQRKETYQIKHFRWFDHRMQKLRSSSMLTQNKNGPCPLLALVNALILGAQDRDQAILDEFLSTREQVTLGTIIENLMEELLSSGRNENLPDVDELNRFLLKLRTGMNMNPRFVPRAPAAPNLMDARNSMLHIVTPKQPRNLPGGFERTQDNALYGAFNIKTVHGWLPEPGTDAATAFQRSAQNYEDAQAKLFGEDELEYKLARNGLSPEEQVVWQDVISIKNFFATNPTQLTPYGLFSIQSSMQPGTFAILFRNDHFSTIYKHPQTGILYTLITDAGYAERDEIVWESLVDISGQHSEFFAGDFQSVSHGAQQQQLGTHHFRQSPGLVDTQNVDSSTPLSPLERQEQEDADLAMAMQLQEEEEQRHRQRTASQSQQGQISNSNQNRATGRRSAGNIPITLNSSGLSSQEIRPLIPARNSRSNVQGVTRPADANSSDAPPAYEEAAKGKPYNPPLGSPLHPHSSADLTSVDHTQASGSTSRPAAPRSRRRSSAYNDNNMRQSNSGFGGDGPSPAYDFTDGRMPGSYIHTGHGGHGQSGHLGGYPSSNSAHYHGNQPGMGGRGGRDRDRDRDCVVM